MAHIMIIIGITGTLGAGKGTVVEYLKKRYGFVHYSVREFLEEEAVRRGLPLNRDSLTVVANDLRAKHSPSYIVEKLYERASSLSSQHAAGAVIESIRTPGEIDFLSSQSDFRLWAVDADVKERYRRAVLRNSETDRVSFDTFVSHEQREMNSTDPNRQNLSECIRRAGHVLNNNGNLNALYRQVDLLIREELPLE